MEAKEDREGRRFPTIGPRPEGGQNRRAVPNWVLIGGGGVLLLGALYLLARNSQGASQSSAASTQDSSGSITGGEPYTNLAPALAQIQTNEQQLASELSTLPAGGASGRSVLATTRNRFAYRENNQLNYDVSMSSLPLYGTPSNVTAPIGTVPYGQAGIAITGPPVEAGLGSSPTDYHIYYPVTFNGQAGFLSGSDISGFTAMP